MILIKRFLIFGSGLFCFFLWFQPEASALTILIDPGHGGTDIGAQKKIFSKGPNGKGQFQHVQEKDLALDISKRLYHNLKKKYRVYLTRSLDRTVTLDERSQMAEKLKADLFISLHINSDKKGVSGGFETYYLDNKNEKAEKKIEHVENQQNGHHVSDVQHILIDLIMKRSVPKSKELAQSIHRTIKEKVAPRYKIQDRGVKAALFYVLALSKRPSVLLEVGFLSNDKEAAKLLDPQFQEEYAQAVVAGIDQYVEEKNKRNLPLF